MKRKTKNLVKIHTFISGRVQRVLYRWHTIRKAKKLKISGWVRNRQNGQVEVTMLGPKPKVKKMINWLWRGSPFSKVEKVKIISQKYVNFDEFEGEFEKKPTI